MRSDLYISQSRLIHNGWTKTLVERFLPNPDKTATNPHYKCAPPMKLFLKERVEKIEQSEAFKLARLKSEKRSEAALKAAKTKKKITLQTAKELTPHVAGGYTKEELINEACHHYNMMQINRRNSERYAFPDSDASFLKRISVNFLRHCASYYEDDLLEVKGKTGKGEAYKIIKNNTLMDIAEKYTWLADECERQKPID